MSPPLALGTQCCPYNHWKPSDPVVCGADFVETTTLQQKELEINPTIASHACVGFFVAFPLALGVPPSWNDRSPFMHPPPVSAPFNLSYYLKPIRVLNHVMCACTRNTTPGNDVTHACKDVFLFSVTTVLPRGASARDLLGFEREWHEM